MELLCSRAWLDEVPQVELTSALINSSTVVDTPSSEPMARVAELPSGSGKGDAASHGTTDITCSQDKLSDIPTTLNVIAQPFQLHALTDSLVNEGTSKSVSSRDRVFADATLQQSLWVARQLAPTQTVESQTTCLLGQQIPLINISSVVRTWTPKKEDSKNG